MDKQKLTLESSEETRAIDRWKLATLILSIIVVVQTAILLALVVLESQTVAQLSNGGGPYDPVTSGPTYAELAAQVIPGEGLAVDVVWGDMGQRLVEAGAIDLEAFEQLYGSFTEEQLLILQGDNLQQITFRQDNIQFWTNVLWALGLTQQSRVLGEGPMTQNAQSYPIGNYASTGGWTLGSQEATELFNSTALIELTPEQNDLIYRVAENIYRPCCGNHTAFPDCNHGMAVLGLLELMAAQGATEEEMYRAAFDFNSYAFSSAYITLAAYFGMQGTAWAEVPVNEVLGPDYSSGRGAQEVASLVGPIPGAPGRGSSCGAS